MCLEFLKTELSKLNRKPVIGWKIVRAHGRRLYGPVHFNIKDRWEQGKWYKPNYRRIYSFRNLETGRLVARYGIYAKAIDRVRKHSVLRKFSPMIRFGDNQYECGFHFFADFKEAKSYMRSNVGGYALVECAFTGVTSYGRQYGRTVGVARRLKIIKTIPMPKRFWRYI